MDATRIEGSNLEHKLGCSSTKTLATQKLLADRYRLGDGILPLYHSQPLENSKGGVEPKLARLILRILQVL